MIALNDDQETALTSLKSRLVELSNELSLSHIDSEEQGVLPHNVIGIFGARGAGKSTLLTALYQRCIKNKCDTDKTPAEFTRLAKNLHFIEPVDCSVLDPGAAPSAVVLCSIKKCLTDVLTNLVGCEEEFDKLIGQCTRTEKAYRKLSIELSTSPRDYDYYQEEGIKERFELKKNIRKNLLNISHHLGDKTFVVLLDDFDLTSAKQVHAWIHAFLDVLKQPKLIFIITGDFFRLEHLSWDAKKQFDDKTGRALINKLFPPHNCIMVPEWTIQLSLKFSANAYNRLKDSPTICSCPSAESSVPTESDVLEERINTLLSKLKSISPFLVWSLLPTLPRGLENLFNKLPPTHSQLDSKRYSTTPIEFISTLAGCRSEPLFARLLKETRVDSWHHTLPLTEDSLIAEEWNAMVTNSYARPKAAQYQQLPALKHLLSNPTSTNKNQSSIDFTKQFITIVTDAHSPLFHKSDYTHPLRDVVGVDQCLWAELLLDMDFKESANNRSYLLSIWQPLATRLASCQFQLSLPTSNIRGFFLNNVGILTKPSLVWLSDKGDGLNIGWYPLFEALRHTRDPLSLELLNRLYVNHWNMSGESPGSEFLTILPNELWALIVFTDALARCPWQEFSVASTWLIGTYIVLAAAFVRTAYIYTLVNSQVIEKTKLSKTQKDFIDILDKRDASLLYPGQRKNEEEVLYQLHALLNDKLVVISDNSSKKTWQKSIFKPDYPEKAYCALKQAAEHYFNSPMYKDAVSLLDDTFTFYGLIRQKERS